jgi:uncharacterized protein (TIGR03086 family)
VTSALTGADERGLLPQAAGYADEVLTAVTPELLAAPTPCQGWSVRRLLEHVGESLAALHEGVTTGRVELFPGVDSAPVLVSVVRRRTAALLRVAARADGDALVSVGGRPLPLGCLLATGALETAVHAWDLSQACGEARPIPDELAAGLLIQARLLVPARDRRPLFADPVPPPPHPSLSDRLAAYLGRRPG